VSTERARAVADAVLYEGYVLYPYRASAPKNQVRWQFGVLAPRVWSEAGGCEAWWMQTECLAEPGTATVLAGTLRFLQVQRRTIEEAGDPPAVMRAVESLEVDGRLWTSWDEGVEREVAFEVPLPPPGGGPMQHSCEFAFAEARVTEPIQSATGRLAGKVVRTRAPLTGAVAVESEQLATASPLVRIRLRVQNLSPCDVPAAARDRALGSFLVGTHLLLEVPGGQFVSLLDPPPWARSAAERCENVRMWPVLIGEPGEHGVMLSSPIILQDHPEIAPESPGDLFDATEIDEILTLRTMALTDDEKREARSTDARAAAIIDRVDAMPPELLDRLHGAIRSLRPVAEPARPPVLDGIETPWWDPGAEASVSPETDSLDVHGVSVVKGSRVRLRPGVRRSDAQDIFLAGRIARVEAVLFDVEDHGYLAVTLEDDLAADILQRHGRYLYFAPDEVEPLEGVG
jgi:hypothetical protein